VSEVSKESCTPMPRKQNYNVYCSRKKTTQIIGQVKCPHWHMHLNAVSTVLSHNRSITSFSISALKLHQ